MSVDRGNQQAAYAQLYAELSNFDRDADADGWRASVVIRRSDGSVLAVPARATYEILAHPQRYYRHPTNGSLVRSRPLARWSMPIQFDKQGVASVSLPASRSVQQSLGWNSLATIHAGTRRASSHRQVRWSRIGSTNNDRYFVSHNVRDQIDFPSVGWMRVRLTIVGQQALEVITPIDTRPAVLVDMPRRYR
jgi:hypothetical protein